MNIPEIIQIIKDIKGLQRGQEILIRFNKPVVSPFDRFLGKDLITKLKIDHFYIENGHIYVSRRTNSRYCSKFSHLVSEVNSIKLVGDKYRKSLFTSYEEFASRFDTYYISEIKIKELWSENEQYKLLHNTDKYTKRNFRYIRSNLFAVFNDKFTGLSKLSTELNGNYDDAEGNLTVGNIIFNERGLLSHKKGSEVVRYYKSDSCYGIVAKNNLVMLLSR